MSKNLFNSIKLTKPKKNVFDLSHDVKLSMDAGYLVPTLCMECVPGDSVTIGCQSLLKFQPLVAPPMHRINVTHHYWFVPTRILWNGWETFITNSGDPTQPTPPFVKYTNDGSSVFYGKLADYLGLPTLDDGAFSPQYNVSAFPFAAYQAIYNEFYRDQNLIDPVDWKLVDGDNTTHIALANLQRRAWMHDYFTSCLPFAQKGEPVNIPIGEFGDVPLSYDGQSGHDYRVQLLDGAVDAATNIIENTEGDTGNLVAKTSELVAGSTTINDLRRAFRLQEWLEKAARGGSRYFENILSFFGLRSPDARLQRPEFIKGFTSPVIIGEVLNTTGETGGLPQGNMSGHAQAVSSGGYGKYFCQEHGYIIAITSVMPVTAYQQGIHKMWQREDVFDYYWPQFANIGEQEVLTKELFANTATDADVLFGYVPRYAEYKYMPARVSADLRASLDFWHWGRIFETVPTLSKEFVECDPGKRIFAVTDPSVNSLIAHIYHQIKAVRPMPKFGTPSF